MKKILQFLLINIFLINFSYAEWKEIVQDKLYFDPETIDLVNNKLRTMFYHNSSDPWGSSKTLIEMDCIEKRFRYLSLTAYNGQNLNGSEIGRKGIQDWQYMSKNSTMGLIIESSCKPFIESGLIK